MKAKERSGGTPESPVPCPSCGAAMNTHAEKVDTRVSAGDAGFEPALGGALAAIHTCPMCRYVEETRAVRG